MGRRDLATLSSNHLEALGGDRKGPPLLVDTDAVLAFTPLIRLLIETNVTVVAGAQDRSARCGCTSVVREPALASIGQRIP